MSEERDAFSNSPPTRYPRIRGRCPSCRSDSLFLGSGGYVTCAVIGCKDPTAPHAALTPAPVRPAADPERVAQLIAHRACCGEEHDVSAGKLHGYCVVCGVPWPCDYAGTPPARAEQPEPRAEQADEDMAQRKRDECIGRYGRPNDDWGPK